MPRTHIPPDDFDGGADAVDVNLIGDPLFLVVTEDVAIEADVEGLFFPDIPKGYIPKGNILGPFSALREHGIFKISCIERDGKKRFVRFTVKDKRRAD